MQAALPGMPTARRPAKTRKSLFNLKPKHLNCLAYKDLVPQLGCLSLYNTTSAEQKNGHMKKHISETNCFTNITVTLQHYINTEERATSTQVIH